MDKVQKRKLVCNFFKFTELVDPRKTKDSTKHCASYLTMPLIRWIQNWLSDFPPKVLPSGLLAAWRAGIALHSSTFIL